MTDIGMREQCSHFLEAAHETLRDVETCVNAMSYGQLRDRRDSIDTLVRQIAGLLSNEDMKKDVAWLQYLSGKVRMQSPLDDMPQMKGYALTISVALIDLAEARRLVDGALSHCDPPSMDMPDLPESNTTTKDGDSDGDSGQTKDA